ncbi:hypothetical protein QW060_27105 [Myroides ceti]|uniref:Uncharacterized protein n=1 Tax=Paenimyroides ceti TaxID=395087 RepID=A0ABT8D0Z4_9FLAO|nr:hypothetical protein [Paenimyroides ceti]MDN3710479.1 hypothetical protein [Paenimyroides ceti]
MYFLTKKGTFGIELYKNFINHLTLFKMRKFYSQYSGLFFLMYLLLFFASESAAKTTVCNSGLLNSGFVPGNVTDSNNSTMTKNNINTYIFKNQSVRIVNNH